MLSNLEFRAMSMVSVSEMARQCGLSRSRFYQLVGTTFPWPVYDVGSRRPCYTGELQQLCLEVRRRNCGIDGKPVMFYSKRIGMPVKKTKRVECGGRYAEILDGLRALGLTTVTMPQVSVAVKELYPNGSEEIKSDQMLRAVFLHIRRQNSADNVGQ